MISTTKRGIALLIATANASGLMLDGGWSAAAAIMQAPGPAQATPDEPRGATAGFGLATLLDGYLPGLGAPGARPATDNAGAQDQGNGPDPETGIETEAPPLSAPDSAGVGAIDPTAAPLTGGGAGLGADLRARPIDWGSPTPRSGRARATDLALTVGQDVPALAGLRRTAPAPGPEAGQLAAPDTFALLPSGTEGAEGPGAGMAGLKDAPVSAALPVVPLPAPGLLLLGALALPLALRRKRRS